MRKNVVRLSGRRVPRRAVSLALITLPIILAVWALVAGGSALRVHAAGDAGFVAGVNYPWIAYGHDFGKNEWGHESNV
jgi:hypothetical protein